MPDHFLNRQQYPSFAQSTILVLYKLNRIDLARTGFVKAIMAYYLAIELI